MFTSQVKVKFDKSTETAKVLEYQEGTQVGVTVVTAEEWRVAKAEIKSLYNIENATRAELTNALVALHLTYEDR